MFFMTYNSKIVSKNSESSYRLSNDDAIICNTSLQLLVISNEENPKISSPRMTGHSTCTKYRAEYRFLSFLLKIDENKIL